MAHKPFQFKQFSVSQTGCAMKINTDGVILGALAAEGAQPQAILDVGTGTGVIALMLAQRFPFARVDAVEIDPGAAKTAEQNFANSPFSARLKLYPFSFQAFSSEHPEAKYDAIVSNPPFFIGSLKNPDAGRQVARHADEAFFPELISFAGRHLSDCGRLMLVLPPETATVCVNLAASAGLCLLSSVNLKSFPHSSSHRCIVTFSREYCKQSDLDFVIYSSEKEYSNQFVNKIRDFFVIFD